MTENSFCKFECHSASLAAVKDRNLIKCGARTDWQPDQMRLQQTFLKL